MTRSRRGYALVEMVLVISMLAIVFGLCAGLMHVLLRLDRVARAHLAEATTRDRLGRQFRQDVRAASATSPTRDGAAKPSETGNVPAEGAGGIELTLPGRGVVAYRARDGRIERDERDGARVVRREVYTLPSRGTLRFLSRDEAGATFLTLAYSHPTSAHDHATHVDFQIDALLGRDRRHARTKEEGR